MIKDQAEVNLIRSFSIVDKALDIRFAKISQIGDSFAKNNYLQAALETMDPDTIEDTLGEIAPGTGLDALLITDNEGKEIARWDPKSYLTDQAITAIPAVRDGTGKLQVIMNRLVIIGSASVRLYRELPGNLVVINLVDRDFSSELKELTGFDVAIWMEKNLLLTSYEGDTPRLARALRLEAVETNRGKAVSVRLPDGEYLAYNLPMAPTAIQQGVVFTALFPLSATLRDIYRRVDILHITIGLIAVLLMLAIILPISRTITRPISTIVDQLRSVEGGDLKRLAGLSVDSQLREIQTLRDSFNTLLKDVRDYQAELEALNLHLEERIKDRTAELEAAYEETRKANELLVKAGQELEEVNRELHLSYDKLRELDRMKSQFLANMSHELRTPLNSIIGFSKLILQGAEGPTTNEMQIDLETINRNALHLLEMVNEILDFSKIAAGRLELHREEVDLRPLLDEVLSSTMGLLREKEVKLICSIQADLPPVKADAVRIRQVVLNLLSNAAKFTDAGHILLTARAENGTVQITVEDTGIGIREDDKDKVFEEFRQVESGPDRKVTGTGLGLSIAKKLVEMHSGRIWFESDYLRGTSFHIRLPITPPESEKVELERTV